MKIFITGAFGQLGISLSKLLLNNHELALTGRKIRKNGGIRLDIQNKILLKETIETISPDVIINLAAMTDVDKCESDPRLAYEINVVGVQNICEVFNGKIVHISSDYVFDGKNGPYNVFDRVCPISVYGKTKLESERVITNANSENLIIRANVLYDYNANTKASFLNWVIKSLRHGQQINVVEDQYNNPTWTNSLAKVIELSLIKNLKGIIHWGDSDFLSRYEFAKIIAAKFSLESNLIRPISTLELGQKAPRPLNSGLISDETNNALSIIPPSINHCLDKIKESII